MGSPRIKLTPLIDGHVQDNVRSCLKILPGLAFRAYRPNRVDFRDIAQDAYFVLHRCAEKYDNEHESDASFATYAFGSVKLNIRSLSLKYRCVGCVPRLAGERFRRIDREVFHLTTANVDAKLTELRVQFCPATHDDEDQQWWDSMSFFAWKFGERSLSEVVLTDDGDDEGYEEELVATIPSDDPSQEDVDDASERRAMAERLLCSDVLTRQEKIVLRRRFFHAEYHADIGPRLGVSRQRVQQLEASALAKLRSIARSMVGG